MRAFFKTLFGDVWNLSAVAASWRQRSHLRKRETALSLPA